MSFTPANEDMALQEEGTRHTRICRTQMNNARRNAARCFLTWRAQLLGVNPSSTPWTIPLVSTETRPISTNFTVSVRGALFISSESLCFSTGLSIIIGRLTYDGHYVSCSADGARLHRLCQDKRPAMTRTHPPTRRNAAANNARRRSQEASSPPTTPHRAVQHYRSNLNLKVCRCDGRVAAME